MSRLLETIAGDLRAMNAVAVDAAHSNRSIGYRDARMDLMEACRVAGDELGLKLWLKHGRDWLEFLDIAP